MASPDIQNLARQLLAFEAALDSALDAGGEAHGEAAVRVIEKLRLRLIRLAGVEGFRSLLSRALALAKVEAPALHLVHIREDGFVEGFEVVAQSHDADAARQAGRVLVGQSLKLLVTFIGESLTFGLVRDAWPEAALEGEVALEGEDWKAEERS